MSEQFLPDSGAEFTPRDDRNSREGLLAAGWKPGKRRKTRVLYRETTTAAGVPVRTVIHLPKLR